MPCQQLYTLDAQQRRALQHIFLSFNVMFWAQELTFYSSRVLSLLLSSGYSMSGFSYVLNVFGFPQGSLVSSHFPKTCLATLNVNECMNGMKAVFPLYFPMHHNSDRDKAITEDLWMSEKNWHLCMLHNSSGGSIIFSHCILNGCDVSRQLTWLDAQIMQFLIRQFTRPCRISTADFLRSHQLGTAVSQSYLKWTLCQPWERW